MSYDQWLYRPEPDTGPVNAWQESHFMPLGSVEELKRRFSRLFPSLRWRGKPDYAWSAQGPSDRPSYSIILSTENEDRGVRMIRLKGASQQDAIALAQKLSLCAYDPQKNEQLVV